jgi:glucose-6-phosphate dehydrogenase assembly protein OpcA
MIDLTDTNAGAIAAEFVRARRRSGSPAMGMIMTLVVVVDEAGAEEAMTAARSASREHPARVLGVIFGDRRGSSQVDAQVGIGSGMSGERAIIRLSGEVTRHAQSVVLPLLLPDSPVVVWWPSAAPEDPGADPIGSLARRRITDAASVPTSKSRAMLTQCTSYTPGNTDLAWTRITGWRALLAAALDQYPAKVTSASVSAERISPSADLLSHWLGARLGCQVTRHSSKGPGITEVVMTTKQGDITLSRFDGRLATLSSPNQPDRPVALKRRDIDELLAEELRRLDPDDVYEETVRRMAKAEGRAAKKAAQSGSGAGSGSGSRSGSAPRSGSGSGGTAKKSARKKG